MIHYVPMTLQDISQVYEIEKENFSQPWSKHSFVNEIQENKKAIYIIAKKDTLVYGYAGLWKIDKEGYITNISVKKNMQHKGIGSALVRYLIEVGIKKGIEAFTLEVRKSNLPAIKMYEKLGFIKEGIRKNYYSRPKEDAWIMWIRV